MAPGRFALHLVASQQGSALPLGQALAEAVAGGVDAIWVRERGSTATEVWAATETALAAAAARARVLVHDRVDIALAAGAAGSHLPGGGLPTEVARGLLPSSRGFWLGRSVHSLQEARAAVAAGADYVVFGHVFASKSKPGLPPRGLAALADVVGGTDAPVLAIGGITAENVASVVATGCAGVAVISAVLQSADPGAAASALRRAMDSQAAIPLHALAGGAGSVGGQRRG